MRCAFLLPSLVCLALFCGNARTAEPVANIGDKFFEDRIRPLLIDACYSCHGPEKQKGQLRLDSRDAAIKGGELGSAIVPGDPTKGFLLKAVAHEGDLKMPPKGKLTSRQIADLTAWIKSGAAWPGSVATLPANTKPATSSSDLWSFKPLKEPMLPDSSLSHPIDRFVFDKLARRQLTPAPPADKRVLLRRATFDLIGLPPTPEEVEAFLKDDSQQAWSRVIDRLLASPQYGERWARHWLDVARYADSNGMDENLSQAHAWRYRDWAIKAINADMPFDRFIRMQIAGDLLAPDSPEGIIPTGFLMIGPKMLAEDDPVKMQMDIIDEQLDTIGQAFMGITLGCARCHDHKFDPVTASDYYALAGIFKSTKTMDNFNVVAKWQERPVSDPVTLAKAKAVEEIVVGLKKQLSEKETVHRKNLQAEARSRIADYVAAAEEIRKTRVAGGARMASGKAPAGSIVVEAEQFQRGNVLKVLDGYGAGIGVLVNAGTLPNFTEYDLTIPADGAYAIEFRYAAQDPRPIRVSVDGKVLGESAKLATGSWYPDQQQWEAGPMVNLKKGKVIVRIDREGPFPHIDKLALVPLPAGQSAPVNAGELAVSRKLVPLFLTQWVARMDQLGKIPAGDELRKLGEKSDGPFAVPSPIDPLVTNDARVELTALREKIAKAEKDRPAVPVAMAVSEGKPENLKVHLRGSHLTLGAQTNRGFPAVLSFPGQPTIDPKSSGRKELAEWITRADHPLTARVAVNRFWTWHFGDGLVRTPDNFGRLGDMPVHQELLDWLAVRHIKDGWSMKAMHKLIMTSATYQMSSRYDAGNELKDPDNRLHWRWARQRMDAESFRDSLLAVAGNLDKTPAGSMLKVPNRDYVTSTANRNFDGYDSDKRSVYLPVIRSAGYEPFMAFDFPDPSVSKGRRAVTNIPAQSLLLMNGKLVNEQTKKLAARLLARAGDDASRIAFAYELLYGRPATSPEIERASQFLKQYVAVAIEEKRSPAEARDRAWRGLCRALLASNEFLFVE